MRLNIPSVPIKMVKKVRQPAVEAQPIGEHVILKPEQPSGALDVGPSDQARVMIIYAVTLPGLGEVGIHGCGGETHVLDLYHWKQAGHKPDCHSVSGTEVTLTENDILSLVGSNPPGSECPVLTFTELGKALITLTLHNADNPVFPLTGDATYQTIVAKFPPAATQPPA